jgi:hypothetical protein
MHLVEQVHIRIVIFLQSCLRGACGRSKQNQQHKGCNSSHHTPPVQSK